MLCTGTASWCLLRSLNYRSGIMPPVENVTANESSATAVANHNEDASSAGAPPLAESFLAMAKDCRYVASATHLMIQILEHGLRDLDVRDLQVDAWYASSLLYCLLVLGRKAKTLGMDITGLEYKGCASASSLSINAKRRLWLRSMAGISTLYFLHRWARPKNRPDDNNNSNTAGLRGSSRREAFQNRRRAMIERSQQQQQQGHATTSSRTAAEPNPSRRERGADSWTLAQLRQEATRGWQRLLEYFMTFHTGGPHDLPAHQFVSSTCWWCLRLYAAYYCLQTHDHDSHNRPRRSLPTPGHFVLGHEVVTSDKAPHQESRLVNQPQSHHLVALLILSHSLGVGLQKVTAWCLGWIVEKNSATRRGGVIANTAEQPNATTTATTITPTSGICAICQQPRKHPACPVACGHVFCWTCLQKWIAFRPECPVCRKASRPQDIVALYNYQAPSPDGHEKDD